MKTRIERTTTAEIRVMVRRRLLSICVSDWCEIASLFVQKELHSEVRTTGLPCTGDGEVRGLAQTCDRRDGVHEWEPHAEDFNLHKL